MLEIFLMELNSEIILSLGFFGFGLHCDELVDGTRRFEVLKSDGTLNKKVA
jgi:hypothetical protein